MCEKGAKLRFAAVRTYDLFLFALQVKPFVAVYQNNNLFYTFVENKLSMQHQNH